MRTTALALAAAGLACTTTQGTTPENPNAPVRYVRNIKLSDVRGELGREFSSQLTWEDNFLVDPEFALTGLPPGLRFDAQNRRVIGIPERVGFFSVQVAIRNRIDETGIYRPKPEDRWWTEEIRLEIYKPIE